jgi:hypothetical protein
MSDPRSIGGVIREQSRVVSQLFGTLVGVILGALLLAACGTSNPPVTTTSTTLSTTTTVASQTSAESSVSTNWKAFFSGQTSATQKIALLQNGSAFATIISGQSSSGLGQSVRATVSKVSISGQSATVRYSISLGGQPALANQSGEAIDQNGTWKVSDASFCVLLGLEGTKSPSCPKS